MNTPTSEQLASAAASFDHDWGGVDEVLYGICRRHPGHAVRREVTSKIALIDRAYSAGLERQVIPDAGAQAITKIADFMLARGDEIDEIIANLALLREPLDGEAMAAIVQVHGRFADLLRQIPTRGTSPRSFASKYLHFHCPAVPIYDSYAAARLIRLVPLREIAEPLAEPQGADVEYCDFCVRFWRLYEACRDADLTATVKRLDTWLWQVPKAK